MSEEEKGPMAILLPGAKVALFTTDEETKETFLKIQDDWRFARVSLEVYDGDIATAIKLFETTEAPDLVILQTETVEESFTAQLGGLAENCSEGTAAIVIGPVNDVDLYRELVGMGVSDYLVKPLKLESFADNIAMTLVNKLGASSSRLIAFVGAKGGVGTTVLAENMAWGLSEKLGQKSFLLDAAGGWSTLSVGMNFEPATTLAEAVSAAIDNNEDALSRMMHVASDKLTVLSSGGDVMLDDVTSADGYEVLLDSLMLKYPVVLVDLSAAPAHLKNTTLARAHEIFLVTTPTLPAVRATRTLLQEIKDLRGGSDGEVDVILNMVGLSPKAEVSKSQIEDGLECKIALGIDFNPDLFVMTESQAKKLLDDKDGASIINKILPLVSKVLSGTGVSITMDDGSDTGTKSGALGQFITKLKSKS